MTSQHALQRPIPVHRITSHQITSHHITWEHITWHRITSRDMTWHDTTSHHMTSHQRTWYDVTPHDTTSQHVTSHDMTSHDMTWLLATNRVMPPHLTSQPTTLRHLTSQPTMWLHTTSHHHGRHTTETQPDKRCTQKIQFGHRTGWWLRAHFVGKFFWLIATDANLECLRRARGKSGGWPKTWKKEPVEATFLHIYRENEDSAFKGGLLECLRRWYPTATPQFQRDGRIFIYSICILPAFFQTKPHGPYAHRMPDSSPCKYNIYIYIFRYLSFNDKINICIQLSSFYLAKDSTKSLKKFQIDTCWQGFLKRKTTSKKELFHQKLKRLQINTCLKVKGILKG